MVQTTTPTFRGNPFINRSEGREPIVIKTVGIIGAGQMGNGIAHVIALAGYNVLLNDISKDRVEAALATINGNLSRQVHRGKISEEDRDKALAQITYASSLEAFSEADLVIEAATEDEDVKRKILIALCPQSEAPRDHRQQHVVNLDHPLSRGHGPSRAVHRHAFHEPRAGHGSR